MKENKYYWLKMKETFFDDETIIFLEEQENGVSFSNFYIKLCLSALKCRGRLMRLVGENYIPYDEKSIARLTKVDVNIVKNAMELFEKIGLVKKLETGEIFLPQLDEMTGTETSKAELMRRKRANDKLLGKGNPVTQPLPKSYTDTDKDIETENKRKNSQEIYDKFEETYKKNCPNLKQCRNLDKQRYDLIDNFLTTYSINDFETICKNANSSPWHTGDNPQKWIASFDFLLELKHALKFLEMEKVKSETSYDIGKYEDMNVFDLTL